MLGSMRSKKRLRQMPQNRRTELNTHLGMDIKFTDILKHFVVDTLMILALPVALVGALAWELWEWISNPYHTEN